MHPRPTRASRALFMALLAVSLLFVLGGVAMIAAGGDGGPEAVASFGACAAVFVWRLRPGLFETETRSVEALLARYPGPVVLRASPRRNLFLAASSAVFGGAILWMLWREAIPAAARVLVWPGAALAARLLREWGPVHPGSPAGDSSVIEPEGVPGFVVTGHHPDILTHVGPEEAGPDAAQVTVGLLGRDERDRDARDLRAVHVEARGRAGGAATGNKLNHER